ncbi:hypothetical protein OQI87_10350 [Lactobacillus kefiranofaciens]|uniref:hypothetical protein n=1 Tax=Lactobacillus kefiranofaciens TaxID=267818 RepID=UPI0024686C64|nr:hypothetical protein [Lactobacillus kefiranofaciens]MDH5101425.1 hypothetical protein [Lactobacillus kefiranofaciens]
MPILTIVLFCLVVAWFLTSVRDKVKSAKRLKELFQNDYGVNKIHSYEKEIYETNQKILNIKIMLEQKSTQILNRKDKREQKHLEKEYIKLNKRLKDLIKSKKQFEVLANDFRNNQGKIPNKEIQSHLKEYLNNRKRY